MSLVVLSGSVRSGKSSAAERLAAERGRHVVAAVAGWDGDEEMGRRIEQHRAARPDSWEVRVVGADPAWISDVDPEAIVLLDCLATLAGHVAWELIGDADIATAEQEAEAARRLDAIVTALAERDGDTIVVTNEAGWGVVPSTAAGRVFRDALARANRALVERADAAYLVVAGRFIDLKAAADAPEWPSA